MTVSIIVPYRAEPVREPLWEFAERMLRASWVDPEIIVVDDDHENDGLFNRPRAINRARKVATGDVLLIADADTVPDSIASLVTAVEATQRDRQWRLPQDYLMLNERGTRLVMAGVRMRHLVEAESVQWHGEGICWSGLVIIPVEAFDAVGGFDERYQGWGADDVAMALSLITLYAPPVRYPGAALHLYHERDEQNRGGHRFSGAQNFLTWRYEQAANDADAMRGLLKERYQ